MELYAQFIPIQGGTLSEKVILACDNGTSSEYFVQGKANLAELKVASVNSYHLRQDETIKEIFMTGCAPNIPKTSVIAIKNEASVKLNYEWKISKENASDPELEDLYSAAKYSITPTKGFIDPDAVINFNIEFQSKLSMPFYKDVSLYINDIPFQAIKDPPELLKKQAQEQDLSTIRPSLKYFEFQLISQVDFNHVTLQP